jgi:hypothetical protein
VKLQGFYVYRLGRLSIGLDVNRLIIDGL